MSSKVLNVTQFTWFTWGLNFCPCMTLDEDYVIVSEVDMSRDEDKKDEDGAEHEIG